MLQGTVLKVPPLRERAEDVPALAELLLRSLASDLGRGEIRLSDAATGTL